MPFTLRNQRQVKPMRQPTPSDTQTDDTGATIPANPEPQPKCAESHNPLSPRGYIGQE